uniref:Uncharacterized protein n=1 Tax=Arundo donax TaxID=35708 RepID=A0A0A9BPX4_ARUDO
MSCSLALSQVAKFALITCMMVCRSINRYANICCNRDI